MENPREMDALLQRLWLLWGSIVAAPWMLVVFTHFAPAQPDNLVELRLVLFVIATAVTAGCVGFSLWLAPKVRDNAFKQGAAPGPAIQTSFIVANALCEGAGLTGAAFYFLTRWPLFLGLVALGTVGALLHRPSRDSLVEWFQEARREAPRRPGAGGPS